MKKSRLLIFVFIIAFMSIQNSNAQTIFDAVKEGNLETVKTMIGAILDYC